MVPQRICISKQVTFIAFIFVLLFGYLFFAYWTSTNKTSTNSRATAAKKTAIVLTPKKLPEMTDEKMETLRFRNGVVNNLGEFQINGENIKSTNVEVYLMNDDGDFIFVGSSSYTDKSKSYLIPQTTPNLINKKNIKMLEFYVVDAK